MQSPFSSFLFRSKQLLLLPVTTTFPRSLRKAHFKTNAPLQQQQYLINSSFQQSIRTQTIVSSTLSAHVLSNKFPHSNIVFSPLPIHLVLSLLAVGSKGQTLDQLLAFLKVKTTDDLSFLYSKLLPFLFADNGGPRVCFANGLWVQKTLSLKPSFKHVVDTLFKADCNRVDFLTKADEVADEVNLWAEKQTNGLIKQLLPANSVNNLTWLIFANAIYFKGAWLEKFNRSSTADADFHLLDGSTITVPFMTNTKTQFVCQYDGFTVLQLLYLQGEDHREFAMYFYLPDEKDGLPSLVDKIRTTPDFFDRHVPSQKVRVSRFLIPKFKISYGFEASQVLKEMGLVLPFGEGDGLAEMIDSFDGQSVYGASIHHKSFVNVDEEGTEAAAASAFLGRGCSRMTGDKVDFVADHPFVFVIREDVSGVVLFMGQVDIRHCPISKFVNKQSIIRSVYVRFWADSAA
ncbi:putative Serpin family protein [Helianthus anomalus]